MRFACKAKMYQRTPGENSEKFGFIQKGNYFCKRLYTSSGDVVTGNVLYALQEKERQDGSTQRKNVEHAARLRHIV